MHTLSMNLLSLPYEILQTLRMDGELSRDIELLDTPPSWQSRSVALLEDCGPDVVLTGVSALWAFGAAQIPAFHTASYISDRRRRTTLRSSICWEERCFYEGDILLENGIGVTSPTRTMCDVLRFANFTQQHKSDIETLIKISSISIQEITDALKQRPKVPYKEMALSRLNLLTF